MTVIIADSACDLPLDELEQLNVEMLSLRVYIGGKEYADGRDLPYKRFYELMDDLNELPKTSLVSVGEFIEAFNRYPTADIVVLTMASKLSGTYQSAVLAKESVGRSNIHVLDSGTVSVPLGILIKIAVQMRDRGQQTAEIVAKMRELIPKIRIYAIIDSLRYLVKGGRITGLKGMIGEVLNLKPIVSIIDGIVSPVAMARGMKKAQKELVRLLREKQHPDLSLPLGLAYTVHLKYVEEFHKICPFRPTQKPYHLGSVVGSYGGPGVVAIGYFEGE